MNSIKFCNKRALELNGLKKQEALNIIKNTLNIDIPYRRYHFLEINRLNELVNWNTIFTYNTLGTRVLIFLTKINGKNTIYYVIRKTETVISVRGRFKDEVFNNTVLEGEMMKIDNKWGIGVSDILSYNNENIINEPFSYRLNLLKDIIENNYYRDDDIEPAFFFIKDFFPTSQIKSFNETYEPSIPIQISGLLFKSLDSKPYDILYIYPKNKNKNKKQEPKKIDENDYRESVPNKSQSNKNEGSKKLIIEKRNCIFILKNTSLPDVYQLMCKLGGNIVFYNYAGIPNIEVSKRIQEWVKNNEELKVSATFNTNLKKWEPVEIIKDERVIDYKNIIEDIEKLY